MSTIISRRKEQREGVLSICTHSPGSLPPSGPAEYPPAGILVAPYRSLCSPGALPSVPSYPGVPFEALICSLFPPSALLPPLSETVSRHSGPRVALGARFPSRRGQSRLWGTASSATHVPGCRRGAALSPAGAAVG